MIFLFHSFLIVRRGETLTKIHPTGSEIRTAAAGLTYPVRAFIASCVRPVDGVLRTRRPRRISPPRETNQKQQHNGADKIQYKAHDNDPHDKK